MQSKEIYFFTKNIYCDWYIEAVKAFINEIDDKKLIKEIQNCSSYCFTELLKVFILLYHSLVMKFIFLT